MLYTERVETFLSIALYAVFMLAGLSAAAAAFTFVGVWLSDQSDEDGAH